MRLQRFAAQRSDFSPLCSFTVKRHACAEAPCSRARRVARHSGQSDLQTRLERIVRRKQVALKEEVDALGTEDLEAKLNEGMANPAARQFRLGGLIEGQGIEVPKLGKDEAPSAMAERAKVLKTAGAHALCVRTDSDDTQSGLSDLFAVVRAVPELPVLRRDWFIHPLQVIESKEAGAAGVLGIIVQVNGQGTPVMTSFTAAMGLDAPAEIINQNELDFLAGNEVPLYAINCSAGLAQALPEVAADIATGLLKALPPDCPALVGVTSVQEARSASEGGAAALLIKADMLKDACRDLNACRQFVRDLRYAVSGDD